MFGRFAIAAVCLLLATPSVAEPLNADGARKFVVGKMFAFTCFDGSRGDGRIYADGSVIGSLQTRGTGPVRNMWLPAGTVHVKGEAVCATLKGNRYPFSSWLLIDLFCDRGVDSGGTPGLHNLHGHASPCRSASAGIGPRRCLEAYRSLFFRET